MSDKGEPRNALPERLSENDLTSLRECVGALQTAQQQFAAAQANVLRAEGAVAFMEGLLRRSYSIQDGEVIAMDGTIQRKAAEETA